MERRPLEYRGNPRAPRVVPVVESSGEPSGDAPEGEGKLTKNQLKKLEKMKQIEAKKAQKAKEQEEAAAAAKE